MGNSDLFACIAPFLDRTSLAGCMTVSSMFHYVAGRIMYEVIYLNTEKALAHLVKALQRIASPPPAYDTTSTPFLHRTKCYVVQYPFFIDNEERAIIRDKLPVGLKVRLDIGHLRKRGNRQAFLEWVWLMIILFRPIHISWAILEECEGCYPSTFFRRIFTSFMPFDGTQTIILGRESWLKMESLPVRSLPAHVSGSIKDSISCGVCRRTKHEA